VHPYALIITINHHFNIHRYIVNLRLKIIIPTTYYALVLTCQRY
jgi:hypothetical protein